MTVLALSPHLDDAAFSAGGTLARLARAGHEVVLATVFTRTVASPLGFALACQTDKGIAPHVDYMALRRAEDRAACARLGVEALHLDLPEAPHRGYDSAAALFGPRRADDTLEPVLFAIRAVIARASLVLVPMGIGSHVDHLLIAEAAARLGPDRRLAWVDQPYAHKRGEPPPDGPLATVPLADEDLAAKLDAAAAYASQIGFQFGSEGALRETLAAASRTPTGPGEIFAGEPAARDALHAHLGVPA